MSIRPRAILEVVTARDASAPHRRTITVRNIGTAPATAIALQLVMHESREDVSHWLAGAIPDRLDVDAAASARVRGPRGRSAQLTVTWSDAYRATMRWSGLLVFF